MKVWREISLSLPESFHYARLWNELEWRTIDLDGQRRLTDEIQASGDDRAYWKVELVDKYPLPDLSFEFQDIRNSLEYRRASYIRLRLPVDLPSQRLLDIATMLAVHLPILQGTGGYIFNVDERERDLAYDQVWAWARRYWGVGVVDPVKGTWDATKGLLGINWLTIIGNNLLNGKVDRLTSESMDSYLAAHRLENVLILQAGKRPLLGDLNTFEDLAPYVAASHAVREALIDEPTSFRGMFNDHQSTLNWIRRFEEPGAWVDPELIESGDPSALDTAVGSKVEDDLN